MDFQCRQAALQCANTTNGTMHPHAWSVVCPCHMGEVGHLRLEAIYCTYKQAMHKLVRLAGNRQGPWTSTSLAQSRPKLDLPPSPFGRQGVGWGHSMYGTSYQLEQNHLDHILFLLLLRTGSPNKPDTPFQSISGTRITSNRLPRLTLATNRREVRPSVRGSKAPPSTSSWGSIWG